ncbi:lipopolysaccharide biosynthesis protein [Parapedobacter soli]|uniref:lipopolysaccharide biosynthesis protein n=1 Tax=Parapedobacter soli TaxID=416955 RepID=UPI0021CA2EB5|nr:lipopolysaccharide biosynthesis protein [Parapedobacter soli]
MKTENENQGISQRQIDQISLQELIMKINGLIRFLIGRWIIILIVVIIGGASAVVYSMVKETNYIARLSFVLEEQSGSGSSLGAAANIAAQFGLNVGGLGGSGGFFQGDNIVEFLRSRSMIDKTLLSEVEIGGKKEFLVSHYVEYNGFREKWADKPYLKNIQFKDTIGIYLQDSLMAEFYKSILKHNLVIGKLDKKYNIFSVEMETRDEVFSKAFVETLIANATDFYVQTKTRKAQENLAVLTRQVDSVRQELNDAISGVAAATDANPNPNRALQRLRVGSQRRTIDVQANTAILTELVKNQEIAKITLRNEKPIIQVLDKPILPLENDKLGKAKSFLIGGAVGGVLACLVVVFRYIYRQIMSGDPA